MKSEVLIFKFLADLAPDMVYLDDTEKSVREVTCPGLPIGSSVSATCKLIIARTENKLFGTHVSLPVSQVSIRKVLLAKV